MFTIFFTAFIVNSQPIDSCAKQSDCLSVQISDCDVDNMRQVCLSWQQFPECLKSSDFNDFSETVSHSCPGLKGTKDYNEDGSEEWAANDDICLNVVGGENAIFGVKDGKGCHQAGPYNLTGLYDYASCTGPENVCSGNNVKECKWSIPTRTCTPTGVFCPSDLVCEVPIPCFVEYDGLECPCHEVKYVLNV